MKNIFSSYRNIIIVSSAYFALLYFSSFVKGYGYFIDELYYIACANNPAAGYVDHPPLAPLILAVWKAVFGESVYSIRFLSSFVSAATVFMAGILAKESGGGKTAQTVSSFCIAAAPIYPVFGGFYSMNVFEPFLCSLVFLFLVKMIRGNEPRYWVHLGVLFGVLMMNKHTAGLCILFLVAALLVTPQRKLLFSKYFFYCVLISVLIFLPNIIWQFANGFPSLEFYVNITTRKNVAVPYSEFLLMQFLSYNPIVFPVILTGLYVLLFKSRHFKSLGFIFVLTVLFFLVTRNSRFDRTAFAYLAVIPAGAVYFEEYLSRVKAAWIYPAAASLMAAYACLTVPVFLPYMNYQNSAALTSFIGLNTEIETGNKPLIAQTLGDRIGWEEKVDMVGKVYLSLTPDERNQTLIAGNNYGMAGALELYGKKFGFGDVVCGHNNYYLWSKKRLHGNILLQLSDTGAYHGLQESFGDVRKSGLIFDNPYCTPHERNLTVFICREPKHSLDELLDSGKYFY